MKKATTLIIVVIIAIYGAVVMAYNTILKDEAPVPKAEVAQQVQPKSKYEVGPPDPQELLELVNAERKKVAVAPLTIDPLLSKSAQWKADDMANNNYFGHDSKDGRQDNNGLDYLDTLRPPCVNISENITWANGDSNDTQSAINGWLGSPSHKKAILYSRYSLTGFGISKDKVVQHFCIAK